MTTSRLVEFLQARLHEFTDSYAVDPEPVGLSEVMFAGACRQLQGFYAASRSIIRQHAPDESGFCARCRFDEPPWTNEPYIWPCQTLTDLAAVFAWHPDYPVSVAAAFARRSV